MTTPAHSVFAPELAMSAQTYQALCRLIHDHSHINLGPSKQSLLTSRLSKRRKELSLETWDAYAEYAEKNKNDEIETLIDLISTNHTHFFRENVHFEILTNRILPKLLQSSATAKNGLRCWSAACSSGEEAYSMGMVLSEFVKNHAPSLPWQIMATDISRRALRKATQGIYPRDRVNFPDPAYLQKYFMQGSGPFEGSCKVKAELQKNITFSRANLFADLGVIKSPVHVIFCRNVLIYFDVTSQTRLVNRLYTLVEPGGFLIVGHSDSLLRIQHGFKNLGSGVYQRLD
jgi:chemotaxis protein methyltransferase CheR